MKIIPRILSLLLVGILIFSCRKDDATDANKVGYLNLNLAIDIENLNARTTAVEVDTFNVHVYNSLDILIVSYENASDVPTTIELVEDDYYVIVFSHEFTTPGFDNPYYEGRSDNFTIVEGEEQSISIDASLANVKVTVGYSDNVSTEFVDWETSVSSASGDLIFEKDETRSGYYIAGEGLTITAELTDASNETRIVSGSIPVTKAADHYIVTINYNENASGSVNALTITVDESTNDVPIDIGTYVPAILSKSMTLGGSSSETFYRIKPTSDGGYVVVGNTASSDGDVTLNQGSNDVWVLKLDNNLDITWQNTYGGSSNENGFDIIETAAGNFVIAAQSGSSNGDVPDNQGSDDIWIFSLDNTGSILWSNTFGDNRSNNASGIMETPEGDLVVVGRSTNPDDIFDFDIYLSKLAGDGTLKWEKTYGGSEDDYATKVVFSDNKYTIAGYTRSDDGDVNVSGYNGGAFDFDIWVIQTDSAGNMEWNQAYGGFESETVSDIKAVGSGGFILVGNSGSSDGDVTSNYGINDGWVLRLSSDGTVIWSKSIGGTESDSFRSVYELSDGGFMITGNANSSDGDVPGNTGSSDVFVVELDDTGAIEWKDVFGGSSSDYSNDVIQAADGSYIVAGYTLSSDGDISENKGSTDTWLIRFTY